MNTAPINDVKNQSGIITLKSKGSTSVKLKTTYNDVKKLDVRKSIVELFSGRGIISAGK